MTRRRILVTATAAAVLVTAAAVVALSVAGDDEEPAAPPPAAASSASPTPGSDGPVGVPDRLVIESLDVDAPVTAVGTTPENAQEVPSALDETGWWRDGSVPGAPGNAVIVGHTASADDGVFDALVDVEPGDDVVVSGTDGDATFVVDRTEVVPVPEFGTVAPEIYRSTGPSGLVLMTCGDWNGEAFETTVVVHAVPAT